MLKDEFGILNYDETKIQMEKYWNKKIHNLRDYFLLIDSRAVELKQEGGSDEMLNLQR